MMANHLSSLYLLKEQGGRFYASKNYEGGAFCYILGALCFESALIDTPKETVRTAVAQCHSNFALIHYNDGSLDFAIKSCVAATSVLPHWGKPWLRLSLCYEKQGKWMEAEDARVFALKLGWTL